LKAKTWIERRRQILRNLNDHGTQEIVI
jgi:hypothetical protein